MVDVNTPVSNPDLVRAINDMQLDNSPEKQNRMIDEVMKAHFLTPVIVSPEPENDHDHGDCHDHDHDHSDCHDHDHDHCDCHNHHQKSELEKGTTISFYTIEDSAGRHFFLAFTDWDELRKWQNNEHQQTFIVTFDDLSGMVLQDGCRCEGFVINPFGESIVFNKAYVKALKDEMERRANKGAAQWQVKQEATVELGEPSVYPEAMVKAICAHVKENKNVKAAYLRLMTKDGEQSWLVVVDFTGDRRETFDGIGKAAWDHLNGMYIDLVPLDTNFGQQAAMGVEPFYKR